MSATKPKPTKAAKQRVANLLNAISNLRRGDLASVLGLNPLPTNEDIGDLPDAGDPVSMKGRMQFPRKDMGCVLESQLETIYCLGESELVRSIDRRHKDDIGGWLFDGDKLT